MIKHTPLINEGKQYVFVMEKNDTGEELCCMCKEAVIMGKAYAYSVQKDDVRYYYSGHKRCLFLTEEQIAQLFIDMQLK